MRRLPKPGEVWAAASPYQRKITVTGISSRCYVTGLDGEVTTQERVVVSFDDAGGHVTMPLRPVITVEWHTDGIRKMVNHPGFLYLFVPVKKT